MGLAIVRKIALYHGGEITANSKPGEGATFIVTLPVTHPKDERHPTTKRNTMKTEGKMITILLADDDPDDRQLTREAFAENRLANELHCVEDGEELMDYLHRRGNYENLTDEPLPGLILLDLNMPRKDGREALKEIKADPEPAPDSHRRAHHFQGRGGHPAQLRSGREFLRDQTGDVQVAGGTDQGPRPILVRSRRTAARTKAETMYDRRRVRVLLVDDDEDDYRHHSRFDFRNRRPSLSARLGQQLRRRAWPPFNAASTTSACWIIVSAHAPASNYCANPSPSATGRR